MKIKLRVVLMTGWRPFLGVILLGVIVAGLLWFKLADLLPGLSTNELYWYQRLAGGTVGYKDILHNPLYLPYAGILYILSNLHLSGVIVLRSVSGGFGVLSILCFYLLMTRWYTIRIAWLGTVLFATSSWFLNSARLGTPDILLTWPLLFVLLGFWLQHSKWQRLCLFLLTIVGLTSLYIPGLVWLLIVGVIWQAKTVWRLFTQQKWWLKLLCILTCLILLTPLVWSLVHTPSLIKTYVGLPAQLPTIREYGMNLLHAVSSLFVWATADPQIRLGHLPLLAAFESCLVVLGGYTYFFQRKLGRTRLLLGAGGISLLLIALGDGVTSTILLPFLFILVTAGLALLLQQWFTVFPRNPLARILGVTMVLLVITLGIGYNLTQYFVAWPNAPETKAVFSSSSD